MKPSCVKTAAPCRSRFRAGTRLQQAAAIPAGIAGLCFLLGSCSVNKTESPNANDFPKLTEDFVYGSLALSPISATQAGYHMHNGMPLDDTLDDMSPAGMAGQRSFYAGMQSRTAALDPKSLDKEQAA